MEAEMQRISWHFEQKNAFKWHINFARSQQAAESTPWPDSDWLKPGYSQKSRGGDNCLPLLFINNMIVEQIHPYGREFKS